MNDTVATSALELELKASEDRFFKVFDMSPNLIAISTIEDGRHYVVNTAWLETFGYTRDEAIGKTAFELNAWPTPQDRENFIEAFRKTKAIRNYEAVLHTKSGEPRTFLISGEEIEYDHEPRLIMVFNDITARVKAEVKLQDMLVELERQVEERTEELLESEQRLQETNRMLHLVLDAIPVRVFWKDLNLNYLGCNRLFAMDAGYSNPRQVVGKSDDQMVWKDQAELYRADDTKVMNARVPKLNYEEPHTNSDGDTIWLRTSKIPLRNLDGEVIGILGMYEDISSAKTVETELKLAKDTAESANLAKSSFLSSMSHELRTPLNAILGFAQLMEYDPGNPLTDAQKESIDHIKTGGKHLLDLINEILDLARIEAGKIELQIEPTDPTDLFEDILVLTNTLADKRGITVHAPVMDKKSPHINVDYTRAKQVMLNLLSNAVKYNNENGSITLDSESIGNQLRISVTDTGAGVPEDKLEELFIPFSRLGAEETSIEGTGIGLTITKELVELMDGDIGVESVVGVGTTFWVDFPLANIDEIVELSPHLEGGKDFLSGKVEDEGFDGTVLYVEDNPANMLFMESVFERFANLRLITATNAEDGIKMAQRESPDMLLMDVALPGMSGNEAVRQLRESSDFGKKPIIALSANAMQSDIKAGLDAGFDVYLTKPLDITLLMKELENVFGTVVVED